MPLAELISLAQQALLLSLVVSLPVLAVAAAVGLLGAIIQAATQVQDSALGHFTRVGAMPEGPGIGETAKRLDQILAM